MRQANQPFHYSTPDGVEHHVEKGVVVADKDPILKGREALFNVLADLDAPPAPKAPAKPRKR